MTFKFSDFFQSEEREAIEERATSEMAGLDLDATAWSKASPEFGFLKVFGVVGSHFTKILAVIARGGFLDWAERTWLTVLAENVYGVERPPASFATNVATLTNASGAVYVIAENQITIANPATGKTYRNSAGGTVPALGTLDLEFVAEESGSGSTSLAGTVTKMVTTLLGVTVNNPAGAFVGADAMLDAPLRQLCRDSLAAKSPNGAKNAYRYFAVTATDADGVSYGINRVRVVPGAAVVVYLATATGSPDPATVAAVDAIFQTWVVPTGNGSVTAVASTDVPLTLECTVYIPDDVSDTDLTIQDTIEAKIVEWLSTYEIGGIRVGGVGSIYADEVRAKVSETFSYIFRVVMPSPADTVAAVGDTFVLAGSPTINIQREAQS